MEHPNAALVRAGLDAFNAGDMQAMTDLLDENVVWHEIGNPEPVRGTAALAARMPSQSDAQITGKLHDVIANDDHTVALISATATRNGRTLDYDVVETYHVRDGKVVERWAFSDDTAAINEFFA